MFSKLFGQKREQATVKNFHELYYYNHKQTWTDTYWMGVPAEKCPLDMWIYQEILFSVKPDLIVETGTYRGGSAFYMASLCDLMKKGRIMTIDIDHPSDLPRHDRITYVKGSSIDQNIIQNVRDAVADAGVVLVILDSNHHKDHVLEELRLYHSFVTKGSYLIVEDTNINGHPVNPKYGPGPMEAVDAFLAENQDFEIDSTKEKFYLSFNPRGYLRRVTS
ncbi:MAG: class I SAM-dependent methyltransferase [Candidatus Omnitrophica bacterium]|nr:class I SAM-dependent methyltransferase [Candidatus Omnitrophota bacterium]